MKKIIILLLLCFPILTYGEHKKLTIKMCQQLAQENYPLVKQYGLIEKSKEYNLSNAEKGYLPQLSFSAKFSYQSDVTEIPIPIPGINIDGMRKDQYQAVLELNQTIWDGGNIQAQKKIVKSQSEVETQKLNVEMYTLNDRVNQLYLGILLLEEQLKQNHLLQQELTRNYNQVKSYVSNGIANQADLDAVKVEQLNTTQKENELEATRQAYCTMLGIMININPLQKEDLEKPSIDKELIGISAFQSEKIEVTTIKRPELYWYDAQENQLSAQKKMIQAKNLPKLGIFVQGAYGNPGLNMLKNEFTPYYIAGLRLSWNFSNLYTKRNENKQIDLSRNSVNAQRNTFLFNTNLQIAQNNTEIEKIVKIMKSDNEIISLRNNIKKSAEAKVANGTLTVTDMLREITAENLARQAKIQHEIQLLMIIYNQKNTTNN